MKPKAIIFDCDGVLVNTEFLYARVFSDALATVGVYKTAQSCFKDFCGLPLEQCYRIIEQNHQYRLPSDFSDTVHQMTDIALGSELKPNPGVETLLSYLYEAGIPICVASNGTTDKVRRNLRWANLERFFSAEVVFGIDQVVRAKPAPDIFLHAAATMRADASACFVVEDSEVGVEAALASGAYVFHYDAGLEVEYQKEERCARFRSFDWLLREWSERFF